MSDALLWVIAVNVALSVGILTLGIRTRRASKMHSRQVANLSEQTTRNTAVLREIADRLERKAQRLAALAISDMEEGVIRIVRRVEQLAKDSRAIQVIPASHELKYAEAALRDGWIAGSVEDGLMSLDQVGGPGRDVSPVADNNTDDS